MGIFGFLTETGAKRVTMATTLRVQFVSFVMDIHRSFLTAGQRERRRWVGGWCSRSLAKGVLRMRTARCIIYSYNWIAHYTTIMLVHKISWILKISRGLLANQNANRFNNRFNGPFHRNLCTKTDKVAANLPRQNAVDIKTDYCADRSILALPTKTNKL